MGTMALIVNDVYNANPEPMVYRGDESVNGDVLRQRGVSATVLSWEKAAAALSGVGVSMRCA